LLLNGRQQEHPEPCDRDDRGSWLLRSLTAIAVRFVASMPAIKGACRITRSDSWPQPGQSQGSLQADMGFNSLNGPQPEQR
jgi:hypothetical protein